MSTQKSNSRKTKIKTKIKTNKNNKVQSAYNTYYIFENKLLDISLLSNNDNITHKFIPDEFITFLKKCYKINKTIFPYDIIDNKLPKTLHVGLSLENFICKNGKIYQKDHNNVKMNYLSIPNVLELEDICTNDSSNAIMILYFRQIPEEIGKLTIIIYTPIKRKNKWKQHLFGDEFSPIGEHIIKNGTVVIINSNYSYKLIIEKKTQNEYILPVVHFLGSTEYPINSSCRDNNAYSSYFN